ncbi:MAG: DUF934 domain-containing protein [Rhodoferax sp.]|jgi:uncharacterized protein (DUF934 family)|nr:DUF934 domain-containing protein [Rhodoferax sp.]
MTHTITLLTPGDHALPATGSTVLGLPNDADPRTVALDGVQRIDLHFPKFTDGRAYSQAFLLRRRLGFQGEIRATGDVLADQVVQMQRSGFDSAVLRADQDPAVVQRQIGRFASFYQGDAVTPTPLFARSASGTPAPQTSTATAV